MLSGASTFTSGASILIALSQAGPLLGLKLARNEPVYRKLITIAQRAAEIGLINQAVDEAELGPAVEALVGGFPPP